MSIYAKRLEEQLQPRPVESPAKKARRRYMRTSHLPKCLHCGSEWSVAQLAVGCPTCAAIARHRVQAPGQGAP